MKSDSDFNDIRFEFILFNALKGKPHFRIMSVKVDDNWKSERKLYQIKRLIKKRLEFYYSKQIDFPKLQTPGIRKIKNKILELQENPEKLEWREREATKIWNIHAKKHVREEREKRDKKKAKQLEKERKEGEKRQKQWVNDVREETRKKIKPKNSQKTNEDNHSPEPPKKTDFMLKMEKQEEEEERLILYFNKKLDGVLKTLPEKWSPRDGSLRDNYKKLIDRLEKITPPSGYAILNVVEKWKYYVKTVDSFHEEFPLDEPKNDISKMRNEVKEYQAIREYTKTSPSWTRIRN